MAGRAVIGTCAIVVVASVVLVGMFWQQTLQAQLMAARQAAAASAREQEMLKQLKVMTDAIKHPRSLDWNPVQFLFTDETADGPPARRSYGRAREGLGYVCQRNQSRIERGGRGRFRFVKPGAIRISSFSEAARWGD